MTNPANPQNEPPPAAPPARQACAVGDRYVRGDKQIEVRAVSATEVAARSSETVGGGVLEVTLAAAAFPAFHKRALRRGAKHIPGSAESEPPPPVKNHGCER